MKEIVCKCSRKIQDSFENMKEQVVCEISNQYWKYMFSNIVKGLREFDFIGAGDLTQNEWKKDVWFELQEKVWFE